ncbi:MAG: class I SAM-dependent methyltransferase [Hyphomicrobiaceae bacterium]|nr:class I SAM-dependent methyltransferase [Hyphomicrobiaceae bacterium]
MVDGGTLVLIDVASKFFNSIYLRGLFRREGAALKDVEPLASGIIGLSKQVIDHGVDGDPDVFGWEVQLLLNAPRFPEDARMRFRASRGDDVEIKIADLVLERELANASAQLAHEFANELAKPGYTRILDLGGRDRSHVGQEKFRPHQKVTVLDIVAAPGVDVVGDAHELSRHFSPGSFDAVFCRSVLEHVAMPWKVAVEVAKVLRPGGIGMFHTHQTVGMHDLPWDFWRFSDSAWDAIFNARTGFAIENRALAHECFIIPFRWRAGTEFEKAAGFESSSVIVRKICEPSIDWPVRLDEILSTRYPEF